MLFSALHFWASETAGRNVLLCRMGKVTVIVNIPFGRGSSNTIFCIVGGAPKSFAGLVF